LASSLPFGNKETAKGSRGNFRRPSLFAFDLPAGLFIFSATD
jgi:hypothetical protein